MSSDNLEQSILDAVRSVADKKSEEATIRPYQGATAENKGKQQLVFFFKPELTDPNVDLSAVIKSVVSTFEQHKIKIGGLRVLSGDYLSKHDIMVQHYGVISNICKYGRSVISPVAEKTLQEKFGDKIKEGAEVLGGGQFLERFPELNAYGLSVLNDNLGTTRLAGGTYAMVAKNAGKTFIVLNPFHAYQLVPYTTSGHSIVVFEILVDEKDLSWAQLRNDICGVTDPSDAKDGSIRKNFLKNKDSYKLAEVGKGANGVHMSAGPLEGMAEVERFFGVTDEQTLFGAGLLENSQTAKDVETLRLNPTLDREGKKVSAFDVTEEKNPSESYNLLKGFKVADS